MRDFTPKWLLKLAVTKGELNLSSACSTSRNPCRKVAFYFCLCCLLSLLQGGPLNAQGGKAENIQKQFIKLLEDMGYEQIDINGCRINYSRKINSIRTNNNTSYFTDVIDLRTFADIEETKIEKIEFGSFNDFLYRYKFNENYPYTAWHENKLWDYLKRKYPGSGYPHWHYGIDEETLKLVEAFIRKNVFDYNKLNKRVSVTSKGVSSYLYFEYVFVNTDESLVRRYHEILVRLYKGLGCDAG